MNSLKTSYKINKCQGDKISHFRERCVNLTFCFHKNKRFWTKVFKGEWVGSNRLCSQMSNFGLKCPSLVLKELIELVLI